ncbi:H-NS histone family protein [Pseudotabrizicola sp. L79]|uniref:H-NS histone family protein n=1 Tax=Pseudotabrizicola sp. L79 TaxID=3118402 RepID=UPI002F925B18
MDLSKLTAKELDELAAKARSFAEDKRKQERVEIKEKAIKLIEDAGFSVDDIFPSRYQAPPISSVKPAKEKGKRAPVSVKYRDPANPENTWTGIGRTARWLTVYEAEGRNREDFRFQE